MKDILKHINLRIKLWIKLKCIQKHRNKKPYLRGTHLGMCLCMRFKINNILMSMLCIKYLKYQNNLCTLLRKPYSFNCHWKNHHNKSKRILFWIIRCNTISMKDMWRDKLLNSNISILNKYLSRSQLPHLMVYQEGTK